MTTNIIKVNLRKRLLCCADLEEFISENSNLDTIVKDNKNTDRNDICRQLATMLDMAGSVREKIQIFTLSREKNCPIPDVSREQVRGVVIEFGTEFGVDALAVYSDLQGAWYCGKNNSLLEFIISEHEQPLYQRLREAVDRGIQQATSHPTDVPAPPPPGYILISFLSTIGIAFGMGVSRDLASDNIAGPIIHAALGLRKIILGID